MLHGQFNQQKFDEFLKEKKFPREIKVSELVNKGIPWADAENILKENNFKKVSTQTYRKDLKLL